MFIWVSSIIAQCEVQLVPVLQVLMKTETSLVTERQS